MKTGLDPEVLVVADGRVVPAGLFMEPPTKLSTGLLNQLSYDNASIEMRPVESEDPEVLIDRTLALLAQAVQRVRLARVSGIIPPSAQISFIPAGSMLKEHMTLPSVLTFGCSPSNLLNSDYSVSRVVPRCSGSETLIRSAGFHVHQELANPGTVQTYVGVLDAILGLTDVIMCHKYGWARAARQRRMRLGYGRAGEHRTRVCPTSGKTIVEYRSLSSWPLSDRKQMRWIIRVARKAAAMTDDQLMTLLTKFPDRPAIVDVIDRVDARGAVAMRQECLNAYRD